MASKNIYITKRIKFIPIKISVSLSDLRSLSNTRKASEFLLQTLEKLGQIDTEFLANVLGSEIALKPGITNQTLRSTIGKQIVILLENIIHSNNPNTSTHSIICDGVEKALADDGQISLIELLEKMEDEVTLDFDRLSDLTEALSKDNIEDLLAHVSDIKPSNDNVRDYILWIFINSSNLPKTSKIDLLNHIELDISQEFNKTDTTNLDSIIESLDSKNSQDILEECDVLFHEYSVVSLKNQEILGSLFRRCVELTIDEVGGILNRDFNATVRSIRFSSNGSFIAVGSDDNTLQIWKTYDAGKNYIQRFKFKAHDAEIRAVDFSPAGHLIASAGEDTFIKIWNPKTGTLVKEITRIQKHGIFSLVFIDNDTLACGSWDQSILFLNISSGAMIRTLNEHQGSVWSMDIHPFNPILASASDDKTIRLWDIETGKNTKIINGHKSGIFTVKFSPDGKILATGGWDQSIFIWRVEDGECLACLTHHKAAIWQVKFTPDGKYLISGADDQTIIVWNLKNFEPQLTFQGHKNGVYSLDISPIESLLVSGSWDKTMRLWRLKL
ncbi:alpha/beta hydrolase [Altericista sp. CCNU0014]|uniref:alpha/beta hydrolase n=1 Tax=Altericista sp. CCNU0014 TaxID=3082949 RepID=UPI00384A557F